MEEDTNSIQQFVRGRRGIWIFVLVFVLLVLLLTCVTVGVVGRRLFNVPDLGTAAPAGLNLPCTTPMTHVVAEGDTLESIAERYQVSADGLIAANSDPGQRLGTAPLQVGQTLVIPLCPTPTSAPSDTPAPVVRESTEEVTQTQPSQGRGACMDPCTPGGSDCLAGLDCQTIPGKSGQTVCWDKQVCLPTVTPSITPEPTGPVCGDGQCDPNETAATCPQDCASTCGNGVCDEGETNRNCPVDCGEPKQGTCPLAQPRSSPRLPSVLVVSLVLAVGAVIGLGLVPETITLKKPRR